MVYCIAMYNCLEGRDGGGGGGVGGEFWDIFFPVES